MQFDGEIIHSARDEFGLIQVVQNHTTRKLYFDSPVEQSCLYLHAPMQLNFEYQQRIVDLLNQHQTHQNRHPENSPYRVLMLGMGGGSIAHYLNHLYPAINITVVELRQAVIDCAYGYFHFPDEPEVDAICEDAIEFVAQNNHPYDVIIVDIFDAHGSPEAMTQNQFHQNLFHNLNAKGILLYNLWFEWNEANPNRQKPTPETQSVIEYWQAENANGDLVLNRYNIASSQNLIYQVSKDS